MEWFQDAIQQTLDWLTTDQYSFWEEWFAYFLTQVAVAKIEFMGWAVKFSWNVAKAALDQLTITDQLNEAWASLDSYILGWLTYLRVPDAVNIVLNAFITRFVMRFMGWSL